MNLLATSIEYLKGVGPKRGELLKKELGIHTFGDLLQYYPFRYVDRSRYYTAREIGPDHSFIQMKGRIGRVENVGKPRQKRLVAEFFDKTGSIDLIWFQGGRFIQSSLKPGVDFIVFGKPNFFKGRINIAHPEITLVSEAPKMINAQLQPVYSTTEKLTGRGLNSRGIEKLQRALLEQVYSVIPETLSQEIRERYTFIPRKQAIRHLHFPDSQEWLQKAQARLKFDEFFFIQLQLLRTQLAHKKKFLGFPFKVIGDNFNEFYQNKLPFELTGAQKKVLREIRQDLGKGQHMNRLLQGDVGSGKTMVALMTVLMALDNGYQSVIMAPTEILANQHFEGITELLQGMDISVAILTGSTKTAQRKFILQEALDGKIALLIGTHALIEDRVQFKNLGLAIIDEQHRFGVAQRAKLWKKNTRPPHLLVMTATPIPRTLAMTLYGDLDVSVIDELPPGRKPVKTIHRTDRARLNVFQFLRSEIDRGRQVYIVYPLIKESEKLDYKDLMDGFESVSRAFPRPQYQVAVVHGKMKPADKDYEMERFSEGKAHILIATTVIEVGINVPNASVMVIESAERFGLSQLHQLRGRVGRGNDQSYCILMTGDKLSADSDKRMEVMTSTTDGFVVAEEDLRLRGPGDIMGTQQSGVLDLKIADLAKDQSWLIQARHSANQLLQKDPDLSDPANRQIAEAFKQFIREHPNWSRIS
ncbi:ATP-dependent DNA helicase RecG [bacterium SCSIO 12741]|nr:ATP-dependent DNA helicase RecG [bacterium SCSIO 12741]